MVEVRSVGKYKISIHCCPNNLRLYQQEGTQKKLLKNELSLPRHFQSPPELRNHLSYKVLASSSRYSYQDLYRSLRGPSSVCYRGDLRTMWEDTCLG